MAVRKSKKPIKGSGSQDSKTRRSNAADGYEGLDWNLYGKVRPQLQHAGATGAGLIEYTLWFEVVRSRSAEHRADIALPGQSVM